MGPKTIISTTSSYCGGYIVLEGNGELKDSNWIDMFPRKDVDLWQRVSLRLNNRQIHILN